MRIAYLFVALLASLTGAQPSATAIASRASPVFPDLPWVNVRDHGARGDGVTDDTPAILSALQVAAAEPRSRLLFPPATGYRTTATLFVPPHVTVEMHGPLLFDGDDASPALVIGAAGGYARQHRHVLQVVKVTTSDWQDEGSIGVLLHNALACNIEIVEIRGFTIGLQCLGSGAGFMHNVVKLGSLLSNRIAVDLTNLSFGGSIGWCNENAFIGGRFQHFSGVHTGDDRYGVRITSQDGTYLGNNNNLFVKPSFEMGVTSAAPGEAVPLLIEHGAQNRFESCRDESNSTTFARLLNGSTENDFDLGFGGASVIDDQSTFAASRFRTRRTRLMDEPGTLVFASGPLRERAGPYDATRVHVAGVHTAVIGSAETLVATNGIQLGSDHVQMSSIRAVGVLLDTSVKQRFVVRRAVVPGGEGRVSVRCYDAAGNVLQDAGAPLVTGTVFNAPYWTTSFGGTYSQGADSSTDYYFKVDDAVQSVAVLLSGGTAPIQLKAFSIWSVDAGHVRSWLGYEEGIPGANRGLGAPTTGAWSRGRVVYNDDPDPGEDLGWICVTTGSPGVWKSIGSIAN